MDDLQKQLQTILGDPAAMGQITAIAQALSGGGAPPKEEASQNEGFLPVEEAQGPDLAALMGAVGDLDPKLLQTAARLLGEYTAPNDEKAALLAALRPFLKKERQEKLERAEKLARLSRVARAALTLFREGEGHV